MSNCTLTIDGNLYGISVTPVIIDPVFDYYISDAGDDSNDGTTAETPWQSPNHRAIPQGSVVAFSRGGVWQGNQFNPQTEIEYTAYGEGDLPCMTGAKPVDAWELSSGSEYKASIHQDDIVLLKDRKRLVGHRPAAGRINPPPPTIGTLEEGQWAVADGFVHYRDFGNGYPVDIEMQDRWVFPMRMTNCINTTVENIEFYGGITRIVSVEDCNNVTVKNCKIHAGVRGLESVDSENILFQGNEIYDIDWKGIAILGGVNNSIVDGNHVYDIGLLSTDCSDWEGILVGGGFNQFPRPTGCIIKNNLIEKVGSDAYYPKDGLRNMNGVGIAIDATSDILVVGNTIRDMSKRGLEVICSSADSHDIRIMENLFERIGNMTELNWRSFGIAVKSAGGFAIYNVIVERNTFNDCDFDHPLMRSPGAVLEVGIGREADYPTSRVRNVLFADNAAKNIQGELLIRYEGTASVGLENFIEWGNTLV